MSSMDSGSRLFCGHRALGFVGNHVPLVTRYIQRRREHLVSKIKFKGSLYILGLLKEFDIVRPNLVFRLIPNVINFLYASYRPEVK